MVTNEDVERWREWKKEHPDFPLTPHLTGQWTRKVRGRTHYFGPLHNPEAALKRWLAEKDYLLSGFEVPTRSEHNESTDQPVTLKDLAEKLLTLCDRVDRLLFKHGKTLSGPRLCTVEEVAETLGITPRQVNTLIRRGHLPWVNVSHSAGTSKPRRRIAEADVFAFLEQRRVVEQPRQYRRHIKPKTN